MDKSRLAIVKLFQSTRPARGATTPCRVIVPAAVSIHAPRAGGDLTAEVMARMVRVSIHAPRAGGD